VIKYKKGNLLDSDAQVIGHQVNCKGVMGGGVALQIRKKWPHVFDKYVAYCVEPYDDPPNKSFRMLGDNLMVEVSPGKYVANLFGQDACDASRRQTDYEALYKALNELNDDMSDLGLTTLALPYKLGSGLAGGNWKIVKAIIETIFGEDDKITVEIIEFEG
jgi:O-acetyl-ADP-ribose deacetylase (regulator of RNase III)